MGASDNKDGSLAVEYIGRYKNDHFSLELHRFFGTHPHTCFSKKAIVHALKQDTGNLQLENTLSHALNECLIKEQAEDCICLYSLSGANPVHEMVISLSRMAVLGQIHSNGFIQTAISCDTGDLFADVYLNKRC